MQFTYQVQVHLHLTNQDLQSIISSIDHLHVITIS
jgi:hypothetical protein